MRDPVLTTLSLDELLTGLNHALLAERQAVADYGAHAKDCERMDIREALEALRDVEREHALRLALRITALGGAPSELEARPQPMGETLASGLRQDLASEQWVIVEYACLNAGIMDDTETAELMAELLQDEIRHAAWLKSTLRALSPGG
jgi:bacterioferritin (cytochrome b1)